MYLNVYDVLSMVTLGATLCDTFTRVDVDTVQALPHDDLFSLARWYEHLDLTEQAETIYVTALRSARHEHEEKLCLEALAALYKRLDRYADAEPLWQTLATLSPGDPTACLELAKYHEST